MPYLYETIPGSEKSRLMMRPPMGPGFPPEVVERATHCEVWATSFKDAEEWTEFRLFKGTEQIGTRRISGY